MYLCLSTGQGEGNDQVIFASVEGSGQWFVKLLEQKHLFPGMSRICLHLWQAGDCSAWYKPSLLLRFRLPQNAMKYRKPISKHPAKPRLLWNLFYKSQAGLTARPRKLLLVNQYTNRRQRGRRDSQGRRTFYFSSSALWTEGSQRGAISSQDITSKFF